MGTMTFGDTVDRDTAQAMLEAAVDAGITHVDTANGYAQTRTETLLGELLPPVADRVTVATKAGIYDGDAQGNPLLSRAGLRLSLEASLKRLKVDHVDLYYLHQPDRATPPEETVAALAELIREGSIGAFGVSNYAAWQVGDLQRLAADEGIPGPVVGQQLYNLVARRIEDEYVEFAAVHDVPTIVYNPLGGGLLTGRHRFDDDPGEGRFGTSVLSQMYRDRYWNEDIFTAIRSFTEIADEAGIPLAEMAFRWLLSKDAVSAVLLGGSKVDQLRSNVAAAEAGPLPADVLSACDEAGAGLAGSMPRYNR
nr:aldo/keto reductase [Arsenicicoccus piscis]